MPNIRSRNLVDLCLLFKNFGVGHKFIRHGWGGQPDSYWTVTKVKIDRIDHRVNRGRIWGRLTWKGRTFPEIRISALNKREWAFVPDLSRCGPWERQRVRILAHDPDTMPRDPKKRAKLQRQLQPLDLELLDEPPASGSSAFRKFYYPGDANWSPDHHDDDDYLQVTDKQEINRLQEGDSTLHDELRFFNNDNDDNDDDGAADEMQQQEGEDDDDDDESVPDDAQTERLRQAEQRLIE